VTAINQPRGDSHGSLGETVMSLRLAPQRLRSLRERRIALIILCIGVSVAVVDGAAVAVALPSIQAGLGFSQLNLAWVLNAYLIPFGGLLLFAGRLGDLIGSKKVFVAGLTLFTVASMVCGLAQSQAMLIGARFFQGIGGALSTAVSLSLIVTMFPKPREQGKALGLYAFFATAAATIGLFTGAALTEALSWHWIFYVNVPIGAVAIAAAFRMLDEVRDTKDRRGIDWFGSLLLVGAVTLLVYTIAQASDHGWDSARTAVLGGTALILLTGFAIWQTRAAKPLIPPEVLRARNVAWSNIVLLLMVIGPGGMFYLCVLYLRGVLGMSVMEVGLAFLPSTVAVGVGSLKIAPRLMRNLDAKAVLVPALAVMAIGLGLFGRLPADGSYLLDVLPPLLVTGIGIGLATPPILRIALADATDRDSGVRSGLVNMTQQIGSALGLAVLAPVASSVAQHALAHGHAAAWSLTSGYRAAFLVGVGSSLLALVLAMTMVKSEVPKSVPTNLDSGAYGTGRIPRDPTGALDPDFLAIGLGGTNMMGVLWSIAMGRRAVAVELRGDPYLNVMHWNVTEELYHHLTIIDDLMIKRYGEERLPRRGDGSLFRLGECLYCPGAQEGGDARADEVISGWAGDAHAAGIVRNADYVDDRWVNGEPHRSVNSLRPAEVSQEHDRSSIGGDLTDVLRRPSTFVIGAEELLILLRRYLDDIEKMDLAANVEPRVRIFIYHRVALPRSQRSAGARLGRLIGRPQDDNEGFVRGPDGRIRIRVEAIRELDEKGRVRRVPVLGTELLDLGIPELFMIAEGLDGADAKRLGFTQEVVKIDHHDGRGPVPAQADYIMGLIGVYVDNNFRRRIASAFDEHGNEYWVRQVGIGHEGYVESGWILAEVPEFRTFDPVKAGLVAPGTRRQSAEYFGPYQFLIRDYFLEQAALLCEIPKDLLAKTYCLSSPRLVSVVMKIGSDALLAPNGVVAGDSFGNGSFLTTGGATTGMVGHASRVFTYWQSRDEGVGHDKAIRTLADGIKQDTQAWIKVTTEDFGQPPAPVHATQRANGRKPGLATRKEVVDAARRHRRAIARVDYRDDWSRLHVFPGVLHMLGLQPLPETPPDSPERAMDESAMRTMMMESMAATEGMAGTQTIADADNMAGADNMSHAENMAGAEKTAGTPAAMAE
jgi:EmrB/QacA subfamily drug resistance transporter